MKNNTSIQAPSVIKSLIILSCVLYFLITPTHVMAVEPELDSLSISDIVYDKQEKTDEATQETDLWEFLKGSSTDNQLLLGMFTFHFDSKSLKTRQWNNKLVGVQYNDFTYFVFENSFYTWCGGIAYSRNLYQAPLSDNWDWNFGYRIGLVYGYEDGQAPFSNVSPIIPSIELYNQFFYNEHIGVEVMLTTSISLGFFYQF